MTTPTTINNQSVEMNKAWAAFKKTYPDFELTLNNLRATDYARLDNLGHVYLDYTGGGLYAESQLQAHLDLLNNGVFGNPHSNNPTSLAMTELVEQARAYVLKYFNASADEYVAIFTLNASGALKLVGESYPFDADSHYLLTFDNHNSVNGIREFAHAQGANVTYLPVVPPDLRVDENKLTAHLTQADPTKANLFAYPAQSNFSGVQHPLDWISQAQALGWDVFLDAAAFSPTNRLDLSRWQPDFVALSFYKIFGYPTGVGCLLARKNALAKLRRPWFAGGTITVASVQGENYQLEEGAPAFEDGTVSYLTLPAVEIGLRHIEKIGIDAIHQRVVALTGWLLDSMLALRHDSGEPLIQVYGPTNMDCRGGTIAMNFYDPQRQLIDFRRVEALANEQNISVRTGCFCNPGAGEVAHGLTHKEMTTCFTDKERMSFNQFLTCLQSTDGKNAGSIRISVGIASNFADVFRFIQFACGFLNKSAADV